MRRLTVKNFSCIDEAILELNHLTVLIGPQASGKSVLSKLVYFFYSLISDQIQALQDGQEFDAFKEQARSRFKEWFPDTAWGAKKFSLEFQSGDYYVKIARGVSKEGVAIRIRFASFIEQQYNESLEVLKAGTAKLKKRDDGRDEFELYMKAREILTSSFSKRLGSDYVHSQLFVPAGRSFFTSVGKAVAAFEQARILDPVTLTFGRLFASLKDRGFYQWRRQAKPKSSIQPVLQSIFGGELKFERDKEFVAMEDGRKVPFSALSSGQQEVLPLLMALEFWGDRSGRGGVGLVYIEEPEAHLFPSAQNALVQVLVAMAMNRKGGNDLVVTTHSPYVLAKINNLVKAGSMAAALGEAVSEKLAAIVPKSSWIDPSSLNAYAIQDRKLVSIIDSETNMIDGDYLDSVSEIIAKEYDALLAMEADCGAK